MKCDRCKGGVPGKGLVAAAAGVVMRFCMPCATLLASFLDDPYWPCPIDRGLLRDALRKQAFAGWPWTELKS